MALTTTEMGLCNKLYSDYGATIAPVKMAKAGILQQKSLLMSAIRAISWSPLEKVTEGVEAIKNGVAIPAGTDSGMYDIKNFLERCNYLNGLSPASAALGSAQSAMHGVDNTVDAQSSTVPEFGAASIANKIDSILKGLGIPGGSDLAALLTKADQILECMSALCAGADPTYNGQVANMANDMDGIFRDLTLIDNPGGDDHGQMNYPLLYGDLSLEDSMKTNLETARLGIMDTKIEIITSTGETLTKIQEYTKIGFFS